MVMVVSMVNKVVAMIIALFTADKNMLMVVSIAD